jgi:hypothetical protein
MSECRDCGIQIASGELCEDCKSNDAFFVMLQKFRDAEREYFEASGKHVERADFYHNGSGDIDIDLAD